MIYIRHVCGYVVPIIVWDSIEIAHHVPFAGFQIPARTCPKCKSTITASNLEYSHSEETKAALDRMEADVVAVRDVEEKTVEILGYVVMRNGLRINGRVPGFPAGTHITVQAGDTLTSVGPGPALCVFR